MEFSNTVIFAFLLVVPLVCGKTVSVLNNCGHNYEVEDDEVIYANIDSFDGLYSRFSSCEVVFKAEDYTDDVYYEVMSDTNYDGVLIKIEGSHNGYNYDSISSTLYYVGKKTTLYQYIRITVRRGVQNVKDVRIKLKIYTSGYTTVRYFRSSFYISVGGIVGIVVGGLCAIAVLVVICCCCCRHHATRGTVMSTNTQPTVVSQVNTGYAPSYPHQPGVNPYYGQGTQYTGQPGYPVQGFSPQLPPSYPGYPKTQPTTDIPPPPYPGHEYTNEENKPM